jgi:hypothetical protein
MGADEVAGLKHVTMTDESTTEQEFPLTDL